MKRILLVIALINIVFANQIFAQSQNRTKAVFLIHVPLDHWVYDDLDKFEAKGYLDTLNTSTQPYSRIEVARIIKGLESDSLSQSLKWAKGRIEKEFREEVEYLKNKNSPEAVVKAKITFKSRWIKSGDEDEAFDNLRLGLTPELAFGINDYLAAHMIYTFDEELYQDPEYRGWKETDLTFGVGIGGRAAYAYTVFRKDKFEITFGRDKLRWGTGRYGNLMISDNSLAFDMIRGKVDLKHFIFETVHMQLDPIRGGKKQGEDNNDQDPEWIQNRYLAGHRLTFLYKGLKLSGAEIMMYGGEGRDWEIRYLNPLMLYHGSQKNDYVRDDDVSYLIDGSYNLKNKIQIYGEYLLDDLQVDDDSVNDKQAPWMWAMLGGVYIAEPFPQFYVRGEYARLKNWMYTHKQRRNFFLHKNKVIGHWLGHDGDNLHFDVEYDLRPNFSLMVNYNYTRKGEGDVREEFPQDWPWLEEDWEEKFPTGIVEKTHNPSLVIKYIKISPHSNIHLSLRTDCFNVKNRNNIEGEEERYWSFQVKANLSLDKNWIILN